MLISSCLKSFTTVVVVGMLCSLHTSAEAQDQLAEPYGKVKNIRNERAKLASLPATTRESLERRIDKLNDVVRSYEQRAKELEKKGDTLIRDSEAFSAKPQKSRTMQQRNAIIERTERLNGEVDANVGLFSRTVDELAQSFMQELNEAGKAKDIQPGIEETAKPTPIFVLIYKDRDTTQSWTPMSNLPQQPRLARLSFRGSGLLRELNEQSAQRYPDGPTIRARIKSYELAFRMQASVPEVFQLTNETAATSKLYGLDNATTKPFGESCLLARRLVERGVRFVQTVTLHPLP